LCAAQKPLDIDVALHNIRIGRRTWIGAAQETEMTDQFPFAFDFGKMTEGFAHPAFEKFLKDGFPAFDLTAMQETQRKNMNALLEANRTAISGYQALYKRQAEIFEAALAETKDRVAKLQGQPMTPEAATQNLETMKATFEKALANIKEMAELAQSANTDAFESIKARTEEAFAEIKAAAEKRAN